MGNALQAAMEEQGCLPRQRLGGVDNFRQNSSFALAHRSRRATSAKTIRGVETTKAVLSNRPMSFEELVQGMDGAETDIHGRPMAPPDFFWRTPEVEAKRQFAYEADLKNWATVADRLCCQLFGYDAGKLTNGKQVAKRDGCGGRKIVWAENDFPYSLAPEVKHALCWVSDSPALSPAECAAAIEKHVGPGKQVVWLASSPNKMAELDPPRFSDMTYEDYVRHSEEPDVVKGGKVHGQDEGGFDSAEMSLEWTAEEQLSFIHVIYRDLPSKAVMSNL